MGKLLAAIRLGDVTSHHGVVIEGFPNHTDNGIPLAGLGHLVSCPLHPGLQRIAEGDASFTIEGVPLAVEGMRTTCGALLVASQNSFLVEVQNPVSIASSPGFAYEPAAAEWRRQGGQGWPADDTFHDEQAHLQSQTVEGLPYVIETSDGRHFSGRADASGRLPRVYTEAADDYRVYWGDEALARMNDEAPQ